MSSAGPDSEMQRRLAEMDERLRAMQAELEEDVGPVDGSAPDGLTAESTPDVPAPRRPPASPRAPTPELRAAMRGSVAARDLRGPARRLFPPQPPREPQDPPRVFQSPEPPPASQPFQPPEPPPEPRDPPEPRRDPAPPQPTRAADPRLEAMCASLLRALRELLSGYEIALGHVEPRSPRADPAVTVSAGPFGGIELLEEFERAVSALPHVAEVAVRGYEGADRAILEVRLRQ